MKLARVSPLALRQRRASAIIWLTAERRHAVRSIASAAQAIRPIVASFADSLMTCQRASLVQALSAAAKATKVESQTRSEEHTSELQSRQYLVCRLLLEKKKR